MIDDRSYYPSCVVNLTIRYDEALQVVESAGRTTRTSRQPPSVTFGDITVETPGGGVRKIAAVAQSRPRPTLDKAIAAAGGRAAPAVGRSAGGRVSVPLTFGSDGFTVIGARVPLRGSFSLPHPREASRFTLTFDYQDLPIDPRLVRALGVEIHLGTVSAANFARGMTGQTDTDGRALSILRTRLDDLDPTTGRPSLDPSTLLFFGVADQWDVQHNVRGGSTVMMEGRDIRGLLIDAKIPAAKIAAIDLGQPIDVVVANIIQTMGLDHDLTIDVMTDVNEWPNGVVPSPGEANGLTRVRLGSGGGKASASPANGSKASYWDLITNYCELVGAMPQWRGPTLWIRPTRSVFDIALDTKLPTAFAGGLTREIGGETIRVRRLVYGRDLIDLKLSRKFTTTAVPIVRCISFDDQVRGAQRMIFGQWPPADSPEAKAKSESEVIPVPMYGIRSVERLTEIARSTYEEMGRGESGGSAESGVLASYGGDNADPDLLRLRPLDPVELVFDARTLSSRSPLVSTLSNIERMTFAEEVEALYQRLGDRDLARALTALARGAIREVLQFYQVIGVQYEWSGKSCGITLQFQNYIVPRQQPNADSSSTPAPANARRTRAEVTGQQRKAKIKELSGPKVTIGQATSSGADTPADQILQAARRNRIRRKAGPWWEGDE